MASLLSSSIDSIHEQHVNDNDYGGFGYAELYPSPPASLSFDSTLDYQFPRKRDMLKPPFIKRLNKEFADINGNSECGYHATLENNDIQRWVVEFQGPDDTPYEGLKFRLSIHITVRAASVLYA